MEEGPVDPLQPPSMFEQMTQYFSVSNPFFGPITMFHPVSYTHLDVYKRQPSKLTELSDKSTYAITCNHTYYSVF